MVELRSITIVPRDQPLDVFLWSEARIGRRKKHLPYVRDKSIRVRED